MVQREEKGPQDKSESPRQREEGSVAIFKPETWAGKEEGDHLSHGRMLVLSWSLWMKGTTDAYLVTLMTLPLESRALCGVKGG